MKKTILAFFLFAIFGASPALAQDSLVTQPKTDTTDYYEMSLEQLLSMKAHGVPSELEELINSLISVASRKPLVGRESPGIITLITEEEIKSSGARDLIDVLRLVPGFDFGVDVEGVVGIGVRGNWAHEGKLLLLVDGQEQNEILFATTQFGNHFDVAQIKKIEIIRGPGSAIYGGYAEYGVINIITKSGKDISGINAAITYGQMQKDFGRKNFHLSAGQKIKDFDFSVAGFYGKGQRSDQYFYDMNGDSLDMAGNSALDPMNINLGLNYKALSFRAIYDKYTTNVGTGYGFVDSLPYIETYTSTYSELKYIGKVNDKLTITPRVNYKKQLPWYTEPYDTNAIYTKSATRLTGNLSASYNVNRRINFILGGEYTLDKAEDLADGGVFSNGEPAVQYNNMAFFFQGLAKTHFINIIAGARYDMHSEYGNAFSPRLGLTKKFNRFHFKALYSQAFRAPSIENINYQDSTGIKPEFTTVIELETGYQLTRNAIITANFFDITTRDPIVYYYSAANEDAYHNIGGGGSRGVELECRVKDNWGYVNFNYSYYSVSSKEVVEDYEVPEENSLLAFPSHKAGLNSRIKVTRNFSINPSLICFGKRYGYTSYDTLGEPVLETFDPLVRINMFLSYDNLFVKGLSLGAGVYDILNAGTLFIQPYNGDHAPLPGPSRELVFRLSYNLRFND